MTVIDSVAAWEVLDSRGDPTVRVEVTAGSAVGRFTVPSGASTGTHEAVERRDGGDRYRGRGVTAAVQAVQDELAEVICGREVTAQAAIDAALVAEDGTAGLSRLGANAVLGVSGAVAQAAAAARDECLYEYLAPSSSGELPLPMVNIVSGGLHAEGGIAIQDFLVVPVGGESYSAAIEMAWDVRQAARDRLLAAGERPLVADEGGFAPSVASISGAFEFLAAAVRDAGYSLGDEIAFAVDVAATHFYEDGRYELASLDRSLTRVEMVDLVEEWIEAYPVVSVEDPLMEDDWEGWQELMARVGDEVQVLGDDLLVTDQERVSRAVSLEAANAVLVKPNQAGTMTRVLEVIERANAAELATVISARSGETCDTLIGDLAVAVAGGQIKIGSLARSERLAKYNRLFAIERAVDAWAGPRGLAAYS